MTDWRPIVVFPVLLIVSTGVGVAVTSASIRLGLAYDVRPSEQRGWWGRTTGEPPSATHSGVNAAAVFIPTFLLTMTVCLMVAGALLGR